MKYIKNTTLVLALSIAMINGCKKDDFSGHSGQSGLLSPEQFDEEARNGNAGRTIANTMAFVYIDENGKVLEYERLQNEFADNGRQWKTGYMPLKAFATLTGDVHANSDYAREIPFDHRGPLYLYDPYEKREVKLTRQQEEERTNHFLDSISATASRVTTVGGQQIQPGDFFYQHGTWWGGACGAGESGPGHISVVGNYVASNSELNTVIISEAWYDPVTFNGTVRTNWANTTWNWCAGMRCTNFWANNILQGSLANRNSMVQFMNAETGKPYGAVSGKYYGGVRPADYYCSSYSWRMYNEVLGWDMDYNGGGIVSPNDFAWAAFTGTAFTINGNAANLPANAFVQGDF